MIILEVLGVMFIVFAVLGISSVIVNKILNWIERKM